MPAYMPANPGLRVAHVVRSRRTDPKVPRYFALLIRAGSSVFAHTHTHTHHHHHHHQTIFSVNFAKTISYITWTCIISCLFCLVTIHLEFVILYNVEYQHRKSHFCECAAVHTASPYRRQKCHPTQPDRDIQLAIWYVLCFQKLGNSVSETMHLLGCSWTVSINIGLNIWHLRAPLWQV